MEYLPKAGSFKKPTKKTEKSYPSNPYLQLMRYLLEGYTWQKEQKQPFTLIIPIILYHGNEQWTKKTFSDYFQLPDKNLQRYIPNFEYILNDLSKYSDEEILKLEVGVLMTTLLLFKHKGDKDFLLQHKHLPPISQS